MEEKEHKLFIGGLAYAATEGDVRDAFEKVGLLDKVQSADVIMDKFTNRPKGFAFVKMQDEESMQEAIEKLNGMSIKDRAISVNEARAKEDRGPRQFGGERSYGNGQRRSGGYNGGGGRNYGSRDGGYNRSE